MFKHCLNLPLGTEFSTWVLRVVAELLSLAGPLLWLAFLDVFICTFTIFHNCVYYHAEKTKLSVFGPKFLWDDISEEGRGNRGRRLPEARGPPRWAEGHLKSCTWLLAHRNGISGKATDLDTNLKQKETSLERFLSLFLVWTSWSGPRPTWFHV